MESTYKVVYTGRLQAGFSLDDVVVQLTAMTNMDEAKARQFLTSARPIVVKRDLAQQAAESLAASLTKIGLEVKVARSEPVPRVEQPPVIPRQAAAAARDAAGALDTEAKDEVWLTRPRKVSASHGWLWIKSAAALFGLSPWKWMAMVFLAGLLTSLLNLVPFVGSLCTTMLAAVLGGGLMMAAQDQRQGGVVNVAALFRGFSRNRNQLLLVGFYYLCAWVVVGAIVLVIAGAGFLSAFGVDGFRTPDWLYDLPMLFVLLLIVMALAIPVVMAYWFATPLVALAGRTAWQAYRQSFEACLKNWLPLLVNGLAFLGIGCLAAFGFFAVAGLLASFANGDQKVLALIPAVALAMIAGIPFMAVVALSLYTGFLDIFQRSA